MAERLKEQLLEKDTIVDVIAGPDSYRSLPYLLSQASSHQVWFSLSTRILIIEITFFFNFYRLPLM